MYKTKSFIFTLLFFTLAAFTVPAWSHITSPKEQFGFNIGDDYCLVTYTQMAEYWKKLEQESDRMKLVEIGITAEGRTMVMAVITSCENHKNLARYKEISRKLALAEGLTDTEAKALAAEGKAVVWIDGGLHSTEVAGAQQEIELVYQMLSRNDAETLRILNDVILLALITNPDGMDLVGNWYMRNPEPEKRTTRGLPRLYHKYIGHDNNRDFYMVNMPETEAVCRVHYHEWFPQIIYNHHQSGPSGCVLFAPPFRDPFNYNYDPLLPLGIDTVGAAMHSRFAAEGKPGSTMREGAGYQTWWNGCLRCTPYFHNMIGILTEMIGNPTPIEIPFIPQKQVPNGDYPYPVAPQKWHFHQTIEYSITADRAVLDIASRLREDFLFNIYRMGKNSIERGSRDYWTIHPKSIAAVQAAIKKDGAKPTGTSRWSRGYDLKYYEILHDMETRDARGYILPSDQPDFLTSTKFVNTLIKTGITVLQASKPFEVEGKSYPAGSYIIKTAQAFRPHIVDMFEPQDYPDDIPYPGGTPRPPYDSAGYTLAFQMGIIFDRILNGFDGPFEKIDDFAKVPVGIVDKGKASGYFLSHNVNDSFTAINRLLKSGEKVYWLKDPFRSKNKTYPAGAIYIPAKKSTDHKIKKLADEVGLNFDTAEAKPKVKAFRLKLPRIGLWDRYGGSMSSGWVRWLLEQFEFDFEVVYPAELDAGSLIRKYNVLIFVGGAIPAKRQDASSRRRSSNIPDPATIPAEYREMLGAVTAEKTIPQLLKFIKNGGTVITIGSSTNLAYHLNIPVVNALTEKTSDGKDRPLPMEKYFIPGSILQVRVNNSLPLAYGLPEKLDVYFNRSPVFRLLPESSLEGLKPVAWFNTDKSLRSGWALGQHYLNGGVAVLEAQIGAGKLFLFGPEITFRAQPHGTFKLLFNGIYYGTAEIK